MTKPVISVEKLSKSYVKRSVPTYDTFREKLSHMMRRGSLRESGTTAQNVFWALRDVTFEVNEGDVLGIVGANGAGKSTLLKILSRITQPTSGQAVVRGRVGSLLEVGTGFHPELTGRENIFLNGAILGMRNAEVRKKFDEIVEFSGVEEFIDMPVKRYSSGMRTRLAFSVAAHLDPEILVIDEVLSVGDSFFREKCLGKMQDVSQSGRTILFVSHNLASVRNLCNRGILIDGGRVLRDEHDIGAVVDAYLGQNRSRTRGVLWRNEQDEYGDRPLQPLRFFLSDEDGELLAETITGDGSAYVNVEVRIGRAVRDLTVGYALYQADGTLLTWSNVRDHREFDWSRIKEGVLNLSCRLPTEQLNDGSYRLQLFLSVPHEASILTMQNSPVVLEFQITGNPERSANWALNQRTAWAPVQKWTVR